MRDSERRLGMKDEGDSVARRAFRMALLTASPDDTPLPVNLTQELDPSDILEVRDMAEVIARADQIVTAPRSSRPPSGSGASARSRDPNVTDIFETLGHPVTGVTGGTGGTGGTSGRTTDDTAGPARAFLTAFARRPHATAVLALPPVCHGLADDAYFSPPGRMRSLADATLDGYREPTLLVRARVRRKNIGWIVGISVLSIMALAAFALVGRDDAATNATRATSPTGVLGTANRTEPASRAPEIAAAEIAAAHPASRLSRARAAIPVFDVNSLPTADHGKPQPAR